MKLGKKLLWAIPALLVAIQVVRIDKTNPPVVPGQDFRAVMRPPSDVTQLLEAACYDCHSHETRYPWYSNVAPVSWLLANHIREGREHFNLSTFGALPVAERAELLGEAAEEVEKGKMPSDGYPLLHPEAKLTDEQRRRLAEWFRLSNPGGSAAEDEAGDDREHETED